MISNVVSKGNIIVDTLIVGAAGGTASVLTGGKFANGAITAAFANLWNKCSDYGCWVTKEERMLARSGKYGAYYRLACSNGDLYACRAGEVALNTGGNFLTRSLSSLTNLNLELSLVWRGNALPFWSLAKK